MRAIEFPECNFTFIKPEEMTDEQCHSLPVCRTIDANNYPVIISCWELNKEELEEIQQTGKIYLMVVGANMNPVSLHVESPFKAD